MKNNYNPNSPYEIQKHELLTILGFRRIISGGAETLQYKHDLLPAISFDHLGYDFTANSIEGIVKTIWEAGYYQGRVDKMNEIKTVLEIK